MKQRIEKRAPHGKTAVTLVVELDDSPHVGYDWKYLINGVSVARGDFDTVVAMLALPGRGVP